MSVCMCACVSLAAAKSNLCILHCHEIHEILYFYVRDIFWCSLPALSIWLGSNWPPHSQIERSAARNQMRLCVRLYWFMLLFFVVASALVVAVVTNRDPLEWVERGSETAGALFTQIAAYSECVKMKSQSNCYFTEDLNGICRVSLFVVCQLCC